MKTRAIAPILLFVFASFATGSPSPATATGSDLGIDTENLRFVVLRVYLPEDGFDNVDLPSLTVIKDGKERTLKNCPWIRSGETPDFSKVQAEFEAGERPDLARILRKAARASGAVNVVPRRPFPICSWWFTLEESTVNIAYPDTNAVYWLTPFFDDGDTEIRIDGEYGNQRYMSLTTYKNLHFFDFTTRAGEVFPSFIADFQIEPNISGTNPYQSETGFARARYSVTIKSRPRTGDVNVLPASPSDPMDPPGDSAFPIPCNTDEDWMCSTAGLFVSPPDENQEGFFGNPSNTYIATPIDLLPRRPSVQLNSRVFVIRGKLPETTPGKTPKVWPDPNVDLRYFSMCTGLYIRPYPTTTGPNACVADLDLVLTNRKGKRTKNGRWYTIVVSTEEDKPSNITGDPEVDGVNWLKGSSFSRTILLLRNMLPNPEFRQAANNVPRTGSFRDAIRTMGNFYPTISVQCTTEAYEKFGWGTCVAPALDGTNPFDPDIVPSSPGVNGAAKD